MFIRCRNKLSRHEASIPVELLDDLTDWKPIRNAEPTEYPQSPTYTVPTEDGSEPTAQDIPIP